MHLAPPSRPDLDELAFLTRAKPMRRLTISAAASGLFGMSTLALAEPVAQPAVTAPDGTAAAAPPPPGLGSMLVPFAAMFAVVYFLMIRPQQKRLKEQQ